MALRWLALGMIVAVLAPSCAPAPTGRVWGPTQELTWPPAPAKARIRFLGVLRGPRDLRKRPSFSGRLAEALFGRAEKWMVRPAAVVRDGERIWVADPGGEAVHLFDLSKGKYRKIERIRSVRLLSPIGLAANGRGQIYVSDSALARVVLTDPARKLLARVEQGLRRPVGLAFDQERSRLYVADAAEHQIWILDEQGGVLGRIGRRGTGPGEFNFPTHLTLDRRGRLYVTDAMNFRIQVFDAEGRFLRQFGHIGDGAGDFARPKGVAVDNDGHIYVVDALFDAVQIFDPTGELLLAFGDRGIEVGQFWLPSGIYIDEQDRIYVVDSFNQRLQIFQYLGD